MAGKKKQNSPAQRKRNAGNAAFLARVRRAPKVVVRTTNKRGAKPMARLTVPAAAGVRLNARTVRNTQSKSFTHRDRLGDITLDNTVKKGKILAAFPASPQRYVNTAMYNEAKNWQRFAIVRALLDMTSSAPSSATGRIGIGFVSDPDSTFGTNSEAVLSKTAALPGFVDSPIVGYQEGLKCAWYGTPKRGEDLLYTHDQVGDSPRWTVDGYWIVVATADMAGITGTVSLGVYLDYTIMFAEGQTTPPVNGSVDLPSAGYTLAASGTLLTGPVGAETNLPVEFLSQLSKAGFYVLDPPLPATMNADLMTPIGYAYLGNNGYVYPRVTRAEAASRAGNTPGSVASVPLPTTVFDFVNTSTVEPIDPVGTIYAEYAKYGEVLRKFPELLTGALQRQRDQRIAQLGE